MSYLKELHDVVVRLHGAEATHVKSVPVKEQHQGKTVWDGVVEVFDLTGHPKTNRVYAWAYDDSGNTRHVTVLHIPPVVSPETAVRAAILQEFRDAQA
jgi:hypothetical protein